MNAELKRQLSDRWTVLHNPDAKSAKGHIPKSWLCVDCGVNTAPGFSTRKEVELASVFHDEVEQHYSDDQEGYTVTPEVWKATGLEDWGGCLCVGCLERRIGRRLKPTDSPARSRIQRAGFSGITAIEEAGGGGTEPENARGSGLPPEPLFLTGPCAGTTPPGRSRRLHQSTLQQEDTLTATNNQQPKGGCIDCHAQSITRQSFSQS